MVDLWKVDLGSQNGQIYGLIEQMIGEEFKDSRTIFYINVEKEGMD